MFDEHRKIWACFQFLGLGLMILGSFGPLSAPWNKISGGVGAVLVLTYAGAVWWEDRREQQADQSNGVGMIRGLLNSWMLIPALALGLLSVGTLAPISDLLDKVLSWVAFAILLAYVGVPVWEYHRERQAEQSSGATISSSDRT